MSGAPTSRGAGGAPGWPLAAGAFVLAGVWLGPLPGLAPRSFTAHMAMHMGVVAVAAPLLALGLAGSRGDPVGRWPRWMFAAVPASVVELLVVWGWHAPGLHHAARSHAGVMALEQGSFLAAGLLVWLSAFGGPPAERSGRAGQGVAGLLLASMHMTLLGALLGLSTRSVYRHAGGGWLGLGPLEDQHLGGALMLVVGGAVYLAGGLVLMAGLLRSPGAVEGVPGPRPAAAGRPEAVVREAS